MACQTCEHPTTGLHNEHCPCIGVRLGGGDDAIHIVRTRQDSRTLCDLYAPSRNAAMLTRPVDVVDCWTCLERRDAALSALQARLGR